MIKNLVRSPGPALLQHIHKASMVALPFPKRLWLMGGQQTMNSMDTDTVYELSSEMTLTLKTDVRLKGAISVFRTGVYFPEDWNM